MATINSLDLGSVRSENTSKSANIFLMAMPGSDSDNAFGLDLFGVTKTITLQGTYTTSNGVIATFIGNIEALVDGAQTTNTFTSDKTGQTYNVLVNTVTWNGEEAGQNKVDYTIELYEVA